tara:strand:+ start:633 stop:1874 length:1242 start_codon:yes stop_codon:yes gene_type:complete
MYIFYNFFTKFIILISPIVFFFRILYKKEDPIRFLERFCIYGNDKEKSTSVWIHAASVGELMSIVPILRKLEQQKKIKKILLTTTTISSANIFQKLKLKKTFHKYFPLDENFITNKFIKYWSPKIAIFVDSEIWPNMFNNLNVKKIPIIIINARITKKSFERWIILKKFAREVFSKISLALPANQETSNYLKKFGVKNIQISGNLKFCGKQNIENKISITIKKKFKNLKIWCASSTHRGEEELIFQLHKKLKKKHKKLITVIIPRHINRVDEITDKIKISNLNFAIHSSKKKIEKNTDIYLVDAYGLTSSFFNLSNITFIGGSLVKHGGQNPLEPARQGNYVVSGPNIWNFSEIYEFLVKNNISTITSSLSKIEKIINSNLNKKISKYSKSKINNIGVDILNKNLLHIGKYLL